MKPGPVGSEVKEVRPPLGSQVWRPDWGPALSGFPFLSEARTLMVVSEVKSS